eukprot:jgi/Ulvmu1/624/UM001_0632.1
MAAVNLLYSNHAERTYVEDCANLFGLLKAMELLETAWIRDNVDSDDYQRLCQRLISQKRLLFDGEFKAKVGDLRTFAKDYDMHVNRAIRRYDKGVPETMESLSSKGQDGAALITVTQAILEFKDAIFMNMTDVDWIIPNLNNILQGLRGVSRIKPDTPQLVKLTSWISRLQDRPKHEKLTDDEGRELSFDAQAMLDCLKSSVS